jgi:hypothetical protein
MIDERIESAIREAVEMHNQPDVVADKIIKWFENVADGNESIEDKDDYRRRLETLFDAVEVDTSDPEL